jgi:hypothetical protein
MPTTLLAETGEFAQRPDHRVERVGDADHEGVGRVVADAFANGLHHLEVDAEQVIAAHAGLARHAGRHDDDVRACDVLVIVGADDLGVKAFDRAALRKVESLALGHAFHHVEQDDVAQFLLRGQMRQSATDVTRADQRDLLACHVLYGPFPESSRDKRSSVAGKAPDGGPPRPRDGKGCRQVGRT